MVLLIHEGENLRLGLISDVVVVDCLHSLNLVMVGNCVFRE